MTGEVASATTGQALLGFILGYLVVLATPGQNMLAIGGIAALRGPRGALPMCLGVALGAGTLAAALLAASSAATGALPGGGTALGTFRAAASTDPLPPEGVSGRNARGAAEHALEGSSGKGSVEGPISRPAGGAVAGAGWMLPGRVAAGLLLFGIGWMVLRMQPPTPDGLPPDGLVPQALVFAGPAGSAAGSGGARPLGLAMASFGAGFSIAATNPVTAAFCLAQYLGPLAVDPQARALAPLALTLLALGFSLMVAVLLANPAARRLALAWHRSLRVAAALALSLMAFGILRPLLG
jgi:threonine/homoserine/homoserine lactone efflux protein